MISGVKWMFRCRSWISSSIRASIAVCLRRARASRFAPASVRIAVISDIHGNLAALEAVLAAVAGRCDQVWCLGDVVGYGARPNECVDVVRDRCRVVLAGNHDLAACGRRGRVALLARRRPGHPLDARGAAARLRALAGRA